MQFHTRTFTMLCAAAAMLSGCATVKMPNIDVPGIPEFKEAAAKLVDGFPEVSQAPVRPEDLRSAEDWDAAAKTLMTQRQGFVVPQKGNMPETEAEIAAEVAALRAEVRSYKLDDPQ